MMTMDEQGRKFNDESRALPKSMKPTEQRDTEEKGCRHPMTPHTSGGKVRLAAAGEVVAK